MINVLYFHNNVEISGGERSLLALWENLDRTRFCPYLVVPKVGDFSVEAERLGIVTTVIDIPSLRLGNTRSLYRVWRKLSALIQINKIDLLHSYAPRNNILAALLGKMKGIPVVWHERNLIYGQERDVSRALSVLPDAVISNSQAVAMRFLRGGKIPQKVRVILNGADLQRFHLAIVPSGIREVLGWQDQKIVGLVSNLHPRKNVEFFLQVALVISREEKDVSFLVVGGEFGSSGAGEQLRLKALAEHMGIKERIYFTGAQSDIRPYLADFDIYCAVTLKEACSRAMIEAMACGKPVVALDDGGNPEIVSDGETGILIAPGDAEAFARGVVRLLQDDPLRQGLARQGRLRAEELFDVKQNAARVQALYDELLELRRKGQR